MAKYVLLDEYSEELSASFRAGYFLDDTYTRKYLAEKEIDRIRAKKVFLKVSVYSNERETPHFLVEYQGEACRFDLRTGIPMDEMGIQLSKYKRNIKKYYEEKKYWLREIYNDNLPSDAPPQARI